GQTSGVQFTSGYTGADEFYMTFRGSVDAINAVLASVTYVPVNGYDGTDTLKITATDLGLNGDPVSKDILITVNEVNDAPVNIVPAAQTVDEDNVLVFNAANGNEIKITDPDAGDAEISVSLEVTNGSLTLAD